MKKPIYNLKSLIIIIVILAHTFKSYSQLEPLNKNKIGFAMGTTLSGNGHGLLYVPQLMVSDNRNSFLLGGCLQKQSMQFNGARIAYSFVLNFNTKIDEDEEEDSEDLYQFLGDKPLEPIQELNKENKVNFRFYMYSEYIKSGMLSRSTQKMEAHVNRVEGQNWNKTKLSTIEAGLGFQISARLSKNIYWNTFIAASFYYHSTYIQNMHHEKFSPSVSFGTNISIPRLKGWHK